MEKVSGAKIESKPSRRPLRLSVRALMVTVLLLALVLGWMVQRVQVQREAVAAIRASGGTVYYDWHRTNDRPGLPSVDPKSEPHAPKWLVERLGVDFFGDVISAVIGKTGTDETMAHVGRLAKLTTMGISLSDAITDAGVAHLAGLRDLEMVNLQGLKGTGAALANFRGLKKIKRLNVEGVPVTDADLAHLEGLASLEWLDLSSTQVTDAGLAHLAGLVNLRQLVLNDTPVAGPGLAHLKRMEQLEMLHLARTRVRDLSSLPPLPKLQTLTLDDTQVDDSQMPMVAKLIALVRLSLNHTGVTDAGLIELQGLNGTLTGLFLNGTKVTDAGAPALLKLNRLRALSLAETKVTDAIASALLKWDRLTVLSLAQTNVTDPTLDQLSSLKMLRSLDVSQTAATIESIARLRQALPQLRVTNKPGAVRANPGTQP